MKKYTIILTALLITLSLDAERPPPPPPPSPTDYQTAEQMPRHTHMLIPPQLEDHRTLQEARPHPSPGANPGAMTALLKDPQIGIGPKIRAIKGPASGLALSGQTSKVYPGGNYKVPQASQALTNGAMASFTQNHRVPVTTGQLFDNPELAHAYKNFIDAVHEVPTFLPMFRKLHIVALHEIYLHLVGVYITLNMTSITDMKSYLALEKRFGLNKKTLIVNQLVKVIQSQLTQALLSLLPGVPLSYCIKSGMSALDRETLSNPDAMVLDLETSVLTAIGAAPVSNNDAIELYSALTSNQAENLIRKNQDINIPALKQGLKIIYQGAGFVKPLTQNEPAAQAVIAAIDTVLGEQAQNKFNTNYNKIIRAIESGSTRDMTEQQIEIFKNTIKQLEYGIPLREEIVVSEQLGKMIESNDQRSLSPQELRALSGVVGFMLQNYEGQTSHMLSAIVNKLQEFNPKMQILSPMQKLQLQQLTRRLNPPHGQTPLAFSSIPENERRSLGTGFIVLGSSSTTVFSRIEKQIIIGVGHELQEGPISLKNLRSIQVLAIKKALLVLGSYHFQPATREWLLSQFPQEDLDELTKLCANVSSPDFKGFEQYSKREQQLMLRMYQGLLAVVQTRLHEHQEASRTLQTIFSHSPELQQILFDSITSNQYLALNAIDDLLQENEDHFSLANLKDRTSDPEPGDTRENPPISPKDALAEMFSMNRNAMNLSYLSILYKLEKQNNNNPTLQNIIGRMPSKEEEQYQLIAQAMSRRDFDFSKLNTLQKRILVRDFQEMQHTGASQPMEQEGRNALLAGTTAARVQTMGTLIESTMNFSKTKTSFLWVLKQYLVFFQLYCSTLQQYESNGYVGLTKFEEYAQGITEKLRGTEIEKLNPPIFFYNKETMNGIRMLPQLATLVESTEVVPYPTFPIILAREGKTRDPLDGKTYTNEVNYGNFSFNKFFFIDTEQKFSPPVDADPQAYQSAPELTNQNAQSIRWIKKINIPASTKTTSYLVQNEQGKEENIKVESYGFAYFPNNVPPGVSGFYANIPIFAKNTVDPRQSLIRLYEQPIYAQPPWLNFPGLSNKEPDGIPGVVTVLRGCLGDFASILNLNIFDPCLNVIFASALALDDRETSFKELQSNKEIQAAMHKCSLYLQSKREEVRRMEQVHRVSSSSISGRASAGGNTLLPVKGRPQISFPTNSAAGGVVL